MSRMFLAPTEDGFRVMKTWNVFKGCLFECSYCWARNLALGRLKNKPKYKNGFTPTYHPEDLWRLFRPGQFVFISPMGDISFASRSQIETILARVAQSPKTFFLLQSKNPGVYSKWGLKFPPNLYLGTTIETNRDYHLTKAPPPILRMMDLARVAHGKRFVSIEPIQDFDKEILVSWMHFLKPEIVEVGADGYRNHLAEPGWAKIEELLVSLREFVPTVVEKKGLERLKDGT